MPNRFGATLGLAEIKAPKNGYAFIYISNQSNNPVYFDNLQTGIVQGNIAEENHYYAYGLKIATLSGKKLGDVYEGSLKNNYLYQGAFSELDDDIGWHDFYLRNYDAQIGRWVQQDPYQEYASGYVGMGNDPINLTDPSGGSVADGVLSAAGRVAVTTLGGAIIGTIVDLATGGEGFTGTLIGAGIGLGAGLGSLSTQIAISMGIQTMNAATTIINTSVKTDQAGMQATGSNTAKGPNNHTDISKDGDINPGENEEQPDKFPDFWTLHANYPRPYKHRPDRTPADPKVPVDDNKDRTFLYKDQCAIRVSICLIKSGVKLTGVKNITRPGKQTYSKDGNVLGAKNLAIHLQKKVLQRTPQIFDGTKVDVKALLKGKKGIIYFENFIENETNTRGGFHIDLWDGFGLQSPYESQMFGSKNIRFFEIK